MAGYALQGKTSAGTMVDIPLAATYDANGNAIVDYYAAKTEYENMMAKLGTMDGKLNLLLASSGMVSFADCDWDTIKTISESGNAASAFKVGDEKQITLSTGETITMVILGFNHDNLTAGGKAGITLGMKNALATAYPMNSTSTNTGGWKESVMRTTTINTLYGYLPSEVQAVIKPVDKITARYDQSNALETTSDKLFLFSHVEIMGTNMYSTTSQRSVPGEGSQYEYYKNATIPTPTSGSGEFTALDGSAGTFYTTDTNVASGYSNKFGESKTTSANVYYNYNNAKARGDSATSASFWWLRSPRSNSSYSFCYVTYYGNVSYSSANDSYGVAFGFCV